MVFHPPAWLPKIPFDPPDSIPISEFMTNEAYGRKPHAKSRNPFTCGLTGKTYTTAESLQRTEFLARALAKITGWAPNTDLPWDKVVGVFSFNTIDYVSVLYSIHRLNGIATPGNVAYSAPELSHQLQSSGASVLFTCAAVLPTALEAAKTAGIPEDKIFLLEVPGSPNSQKPPYKTVDDLIALGKTLPELEPLRWTKGQGARQVAYLCYSSGTSGLPKAVMISHRNVIANVMQYCITDSVGRQKFGVDTQTELGLLPFSHIYGLVVIAHGGIWRGDQIVVLPKFDLTQFLQAIERFKIEQMHLVPPIVVRMLASKNELAKYNLKSVRSVYTGAAPLGRETVEGLLKLYPSWNVGQGYGMTETATVVLHTSEHDIMQGTSGSVVIGARVKVIDFEGKEVTEHGKPGELLIQSPSVTLGYLNNEKATSEAYIWDEDGSWLRSGDEVVVTRSPAGYEHFVVVDRLKELIKVKGHQVAPAELEAHLLSHDLVDDVAVISVPDERDGEAPKAFVVKSPLAEGKPDEQVRQAIVKHVKDHKAHYKWLKGGVEFIDAVPKSPSGKILRRLLRDQERAKRKQEGPKL